MASGAPVTGGALGILFDPLPLILALEPSLPELAAALAPFWPHSEL